MSEAKDKLMDAIAEYVRASSGESMALTGAVLSVRYVKLDESADERSEHYEVIIPTSTVVTDALGLFMNGVTTMQGYLSKGAIEE